MPYIPKKRQDEIIESGVAETSGELNFVITHFAIEYLMKNDNINYNAMAEVKSAMDNASAEFYRRIMAPYEDSKKETNGDVYLPLFAELSHRKNS